MRVLVLNLPSRFTKNVIRDLIYGCWCKGKRIGGAKIPPLNMLYVATVLKENGNEIKLLDALAEQKSLDEILYSIVNYDVVISATSTMSYSEDIEILSELKKRNPSLKTLIFGSHPTFEPESCLESDGADIIIRGEPEYVIRDVIAALEHKNDSWMNMPGIGYRLMNKKIINNDYPFIQDLDDLPIPDRRLFPKGIDYFNPLIKRIPYTTAMTSRGCAGKCNFCTVPYFYGRKIRYRSAENVLKELEMIEQMGYKEVWFRDETFTVPKKRNRIIFDEIVRRNIDLKWICNSRVDSIDKETLQQMRDAGCHMIKFGVESGVQHILDNICKGTTVEQIEKAFKWSHEAGIETHAHIMLGCPGETGTSIEKTIKLVKKIDPTTATFGICTPYAGTDLFAEVLEKHPEIKDGSGINLSTLHTKSFFNEAFTELSDKELEDYVKKAYRSFYFRPGYIFKWLRKIKNLDEFRRITLAGTNIFEFSLNRD